MSKAVAIKYAYLGAVTAAELATQPGPSAVEQPTCYVDEFDACHRWTPGSALAADGFRVIGHTGGAAGRWILDGGQITLAPIGGGANDWARVAGAWTAMAGFGKVLLRGAFVATTNEIIPSNAYVEFTPGSSVAMTLVPGAGFVGSAFYNAGGSSAVATTTVAVASVAGAYQQTLVDASALNVGDRVNIRLVAGELYRCSRKIIAKVGNLVTYDRALNRAFPIGAEIAVVPGARNITIIGNGVVFTGTGDCIVELISAWDCYVEDVVDDTTQLTICAFCYDVASRDCKFSRLRANGKGVTPANYIIDSCENCVMEDCDGRGALNLAVQFNSDDNCRIIRGEFSDGVADGLVLSILNAGGVVGSRGIVVEGAAFVRFAGAGVLTQNGSSENTFVGVNSSFNQSGFSFAGGTAAPNGNCVQGGILKGNTVVGIICTSGTTKAVGVDYVDNVVGAATVQTGAIFEDVNSTIIDTATPAASQGIYLVTGAGSRLVVNGVRASSTRNAHHLVETGASAVVTICGGTSYLGSAANQAGILMNAASVARLDDFTVISAAGFGLFLNNAAAYCRVGSNVNVAACGTPFQISAGALNRGQIALTAAVVVAVAFGDTNAQDRMFWNYATNVGATGVVITGAPVAGTGFNIVGLAGDTSVINYEIR